MRIPVGVSAISVGADECLRLEAARGVQLRTRSGTLWITVDGDVRDFVIEAGQRLNLDSDATVLISAVQGAAVVEALRLPRTAAQTPWQHAMLLAWAVLRGHLGWLGRALSRRPDRVIRRAIRFSAGTA